VSEPDDAPRKLTRGEDDATPLLALGSVALTIAVVAGLVIVALLAIWLLV
jgi:hypothetical protein